MVANNYYNPAVQPLQKGLRVVEMPEEPSDPKSLNNSKTQNPEELVLPQRIGFFGDDVIESGVDNKARLARIKQKLLESFESTYKSVREEVAVTNRDNLYLMIVNFLGGDFGSLSFSTQ